MEIYVRIKIVELDLDGWNLCLFFILIFKNYILLYIFFVIIGLSWIFLRIMIGIEKNGSCGEELFGLMG